MLEAWGDFQQVYVVSALCTFVPVAVMLIVLVIVLLVNRNKMSLLYEGTIEYGFSHEGHEKKGVSYARTRVLEQVRSKVDQMVNIREFESFAVSNKASNKDFSFSPSEYEVKLGLGDSKSSQEKEAWVRQNFYLVNVGNVRDVPGTVGESFKQDPWTNKRSYSLWGTFYVDLEIWGK